MAISSAVDASAVARVVGIETIFKEFRAGSILKLPQRIAVVGQGATLASYSTNKVQVTSASQAGNLVGYGTPLHLVTKQLLPVNGDGVGSIPVTLYPLDDAGSGVAAAGDITPAGAATSTGSFKVVVNEIQSEEFVINTGDSIATIVTAITTAINAVLDMPVVAVDNTTDVELTSKWKGTSANDITVRVDGLVSVGITFGITQPTGGLVNPDVDDALNQVGDVWETLVINCMEIADTTSLTKYSTFGEGRWGALTRKPLVVFTGNTEATPATSVTVSDARPTDRVNSQLVAPGSENLPCVVAARQVARIAVRANNNPPYDYGGLDATGLVPGTDQQQWNYTQKDFVVKRGSSTTDVVDGVVNLSDIITFYKPTGEDPPAYRYVVDIIKLMNIIFNIDLIFNSDEWNGAPLIQDNQPTTNPAAKKPKMARGAVAGTLDALGLEAIIADPETAKDSVLAEIDAQNPKRLNLCIPVQVSGNSNIISIDLKWGFFFGTPQVLA